MCLLNSYVNAANERVVAEHLRGELGVPVCISAEVSPQIREYPRMVTTACNGDDAGDRARTSTSSRSGWRPRASAARC